MPTEHIVSLPGAAAGEAILLSAIPALPGSPRWQTGNAGEGGVSESPPGLSESGLLWP